MIDGSRLVLLVLLCAACGSGATSDGGHDAAADAADTPDADAAVSADGGDGGDGGGDGGASDGGLPGGPFPEGAPFETAEEIWEYAEVEGAVCGNGSPLGVAVNRSTASNDVLLFFAGGGACWDVNTCFVLRSAVHLDENVGEAVVLGEAQASALRVFLDRDDPDNAFPDASYVYVPYCTGDVHAGTRVATYEALGMTRMVHHVGATNTDLILSRMRATWSEAERVWVTGVSAGGYGTTMHWWRVAEAFPAARVDALSDSGLPIAPSAARMAEMRSAWAPRFPPGCAECETEMGFAGLLPHYAATRPEDAQYGLLAYTHDGVIGLYFDRDGAAVERALGALRTAAPPSQRTFYVDGVDHVLSPMPALTRDGVSIADFVRRFATRDPTWEHVGP